jgi:hypothetical protein
VCSVVVTTFPLFYQITLKKRKNLEQLIQIMQYKVQMLQQGGEK